MDRYRTNKRPMEEAGTCRRANSALS